MAGRVLVTGAAGSLGSHTVRVLHAAGHEIVATDAKTPSDLPVEVRRADLLDYDALRPLLEGVEAVVHLGNHASVIPGEPLRTLRENVQMNAHVLHAAAEAKARMLLFASSVQVFASEEDPHRRPWAPAPLPYLPYDGDVPPAPGNHYALSKEATETMLRYFSRRHDMAVVALRFPAMYELEDLRDAEAAEPEPLQVLRAFSYMSFLDAARLTEAIVRAGPQKLPGYRVYFPAAPDNLTGRQATELVREHYAGVPLRVPMERLESLVDVSRITADTGWTPRDRITLRRNG